MKFQLFALLLLAVFYGCYFGKMAGQRRRGIRTDQLGRGKTGLARRVELSTKAAAVLVPAAEAASVLLGRSALPFPARAAGLALTAAGTAVFVCSVLTMKDSWRAGVSPDERTHLVTGGVYRYSRNPAFLGFDLVYLGILLMFWNPPLALLSGTAAALFHLQIVMVEEPHLSAAFGEEYLAYRRRVRRYLGRRRSPQ